MTVDFTAIRLFNVVTVYAREKQRLEFVITAMEWYDGGGGAYSYQLMHRSGIFSTNASMHDIVEVGTISLIELRAIPNIRLQNMVKAIYGDNA